MNKIGILAKISISKKYLVYSLVSTCVVLEKFEIESKNWLSKCMGRVQSNPIYRVLPYL